MEVNFSYNKAQTIQALRYHFITQKEIKWLIITVNLFAILSGVLFFLHKIRPEPFLLGSIIWLCIMLAVWYIMPYAVYKKTRSFKETYTLYANHNGIELKTQAGAMFWNWGDFKKFIETAHFFFIYCSPKSFFLIPKQPMDDDKKHEFWKLCIENIKP